MDRQAKLAVLEEIAAEFNEKGITWAVGASLLLYFKGIVADFNDIDIMIAEEDVGRVRGILAEYGTLKPENPNPLYKTHIFLEYLVDGVELDIMAGFEIVTADGEQFFPLKKEDIRDFVRVNETRIPLQSVEEWRKYYVLMGREEKVRLIDAARARGAGE